MPGTFKTSLGGNAVKGHHFHWVDGLRGRDFISPGGGIAEKGLHFPGWRDCGEGTSFPRVEGLRERDTISRTEGSDMVPTRTPETTEFHGPDP
ncbi:MAG: hypothetical protein R6U78_01300 [Bacteroidales bacterium]